MILILKVHDQDQPIVPEKQHLQLNVASTEDHEKIHTERKATSSDVSSNNSSSLPNSINESNELLSNLKRGALQGTPSNSSQPLLENVDQESLVAAHSMTSLANGSNENLMAPTMSESSGSFDHTDLGNGAQEIDDDRPKIQYRVDPTYQDLSGGSSTSDLPQELPISETGHTWNSKQLPLPVDMNQANSHWNPYQFNTKEDQVLPPASALLKIPKGYDNMKLPHNGSNFNAGQGPLPGFHDIQSLPNPTRVGIPNGNPPHPMQDPRIAYQGQIMNHPEFYIMPNDGTAMLPAGPVHSAHMFNNFPPDDPHAFPATNVEISETEQYQESAVPKYHRRSQSSKAAKPTNNNYLNVVKNYVFSPRDEYIVASQGLYGKPEEKDNFYIAISPEINPSDVRSIDHKGLISKYIDYLLVENEHITEMSKSVSIPIENCVMDDPYLMDIVRVKIPFPTPKYLQWLTAYYPTIQVDWPAIRKELAAFNGTGGKKPKRTYFVDRRPCHILLGESFYFFQREKDKQEK